jgi:hypothetical protein
MGKVQKQLDKIKVDDKIRQVINLDGFYYFREDKIKKIFEAMRQDIEKRFSHLDYWWYIDLWVEEWLR